MLLRGNTLKSDHLSIKIFCIFSQVKLLEGGADSKVEETVGLENVASQKEEGDIVREDHETDLSMYI